MLHFFNKCIFTLCLLILNFLLKATPPPQILAYLQVLVKNCIFSLKNFCHKINKNIIFNVYILINFITKKLYNIIVIKLLFTFFTFLHFFAKCVFLHVYSIY